MSAKLSIYGYREMARGATVRYTPAQIAEHELAMGEERARQNMEIEDPLLEADKPAIDAELDKRAVQRHTLFVDWLMNIVKTRGKIAAIKAYRETGPIDSSLIHAKNTIEDMMKRTNTVQATYIGAGEWVVTERKP